MCISFDFDNSCSAMAAKGAILTLFAEVNMRKLNMYWENDFVELKHSNNIKGNGDGNMVIYNKMLEIINKNIGVLIDSVGIDRLNNPVLYIKHNVKDRKYLIYNMGALEKLRLNLNSLFGEYGAINNIFVYQC